MSNDRYELDIDVNAQNGVKAFQQLEKAEAAVRKESDKLTAALQKQQAAADTLGKRYSTVGAQSTQMGKRYAEDSRLLTAQISNQRALETQLQSSSRAQLAYAASVQKLGGTYGQNIAELQANNAAQKSQQAQFNASAKAQIAYAAQVQRLNGVYGDNTAQLQANIAAQNKHFQSLSNTRYALYDAAQAYIGLAGAMGGPAIAAITFNTVFEKSFSSVRRTTLVTGQELESLRADLVALSTSMPTSFDSLAQIATIGAQLGVATRDIENFTKLVSQFSATTNVSVEETSKGLGRLAQLTKTAGYEYENLGSAIYQVGVTSVATEKEILDMASEIATSGNLAGFANYQIVALAGALASLGVQPEAARGSLMRIFNTIETGATSGGEKLEKLAQISGMTSAEFAKTWGSDAQAAFTAFVNGLSNIQKQGGNTNSVLKDLGVSAVRDIRTMEILANNTGIYANALKESESAYASGTALQEGYAIQMQNLADKMVILGNVLKAIADSVGQGFAPILLSAADAAKRLADAFLLIVNNPVGKFFAGLAVGVAAAGAAALAWQGIMALVKAGVIALTVSFQGIRENASLLSGGLVELTREFLNTSYAMAGTNAAARSTGTTLAATATEAYVAQRALEGSGQGARLATAAMKGFKLTLASTGVGLALMAIPEIINQIGEAFKSNSEKAQDFFGSFDNLDSAIAKDTEIWKENGESIRTIKGEVSDAAAKTTEYSSVVSDAGLTQKSFGGETDTATAAIKNQTIALGANSKAAYVNYLAQNKDFSDAYTQSREELKKLGFDMSTYLDATLKGTGEAYIQSLRSKLVDLRDAAEMAPVGAGSTRTQQENEQIKRYRDLIGLLDRMSQGSAQLDTKSRELANSQLFAADAGVDLTGGLKQEGDTAGETAGKLSELVAESTKTVSATVSIQKAVYDLTSSLAENGNAFTSYTEAGRNNLDALSSTLETLAKSAGDNTDEFAANLIGVVETLQASGTEITGELDYLVDLMQTTFGNAWGVNVDTTAARTDLAAFISQTIAALKQRLLLERQNAAAALSLKDWAAYNNATIAAKNAEKQLTSVQSIQAASSKTAEQATKGVAKAHDKQANSAKNAGNASKGLTKTVRTMTDYMSDLKKVLSTAFDIRFGAAQAKRDLADIQEAIVASVESMSAHSEVLSERITATFGASNAQDEITKSVRAIADAYKSAADDVRDATQAILDAQADLADNSANRKIAEYQLSVAEMYGDELRAAEIRANLVELDAQSAKAQSDLVSAQESLASAQSRTSKTLLGSSDAAVENRSAVEELLDKYIDYAKSVRKSGATQKTANALIEDARSAFLAQAAALGFNSDELVTYARAIDPVTDAELEQTKAARETAKQMEDLTDKWTDYILELKNSGASSSAVSIAMKNAKTDIQNLGTQMGLSGTAIAPYTAQIDSIKTAIDKVPKNLTVSFDPDPMKRALAEFDTALDKTQGKASTLKDTLGKLGGGDGGTIKTPEIDDKKLRKLALQAKRLLYLQYAAGYAGKGQTSNYNHWISEAEKIENKISSGNYQQGGFTGHGAATEVAGVVHKGEFVVPKPMVNQSTGLPYADALGRIMRGYQGGGYVTAPPRAASASTSIVELSPTDRALLAAAGNVSIAVDGKVLAATVNKANKNSNIRGQG